MSDFVFDNPVLYRATVHLRIPVLKNEYAYKHALIFLLYK